MNVVMVLIDSLNRHCLEAYGPTSIRSPNLSRFAERALRFDSHFVGSLPCMPARREMFTGRKEMMWRPWGPLEPYDERLPELLARRGFATGLVTDHYHYWEEEANGYLQSFQSSELVRGHEWDNWKALPGPVEELPDWAARIEEWRPGQGRRYYANVKGFQREEDFFSARVFSAGARWLRENALARPFFLQVESFDVHEPFHVPEPYLSMYTDPALARKYTVWPPYQNEATLARYLDQASGEQIDFLRAQYGGKVTMVDHWFGKLLDTFDELNLWETTAVIVTTDHGHDLGEHRKLAKKYPHYDTHSHIPLMVWHPEFGGNGESIQSLTTTVDLFATVLDMANVPVPEVPHSRSLAPLLEDHAATVRDAVLYGTFGQGVCCTDGEWTVFKAPEQQEALFSYTPQLHKSLTVENVRRAVASGSFIPGVEYPQWKIPIDKEPFSRQDFLFNRLEDPEQEHNLWNDAPEQRARMLGVLKELIREEGAPPEQFARLGLNR